MASTYLVLPVPDSGSPGTVDSFNGRTGVVVAASNDYTVAQIDASALTAGGVVFSNGTNLTVDSGNFNYDDANNRLTIGSQENAFGLNGVSLGSKLSVHAEGGTDLLESSIHRHSDTAAFGANLVLMRTRGTEASESIVQSGDALGYVDAWGFNGTDFTKAAQIAFDVDGTPGAADMPGRIRFLVTPDGSTTLAEAFRISQDKFALFADGGAFTSKLKIGGTTASTNQLEIICASSTTVGQSITLAASQTADAFQLFSSSGVERFAIRASGSHTFWDGQTETISSGINAIDVGGTLTFDNASSAITGFLYDSSIAFTAVPSAGVVGIFFNYQPTFDMQAASAFLSPPLGYNYAPIINANAVANTSIGLFPGFRANPTFSVSNAGTWANTSVWNNYSATCIFTGAGTTWGTLRDFYATDASGTGSIVTQVGFECASLSKATTNISFRALGTTSQNRFVPKTKFGADSAPAVDVDINGAVSYAKSTISLTADNQVVSTSNISYISLSSDNATATNRTFVLTQSTVAGQQLILEWTGTNAGELIDDSAQNGGGNHRLSATWTPTQYDTLHLVSNGTDWIELGRSTN